MKAILVPVVLLGASMLNGQISVGIRIGAPPPPRVIRVQPRTPGPDYIWVESYWYPVGNHYKWHDGYWTRPPYLGAHWVSPRHDGERFYEGYWEGDRGKRDHDHHRDRNRRRDYDRDDRD